MKFDRSLAERLFVDPHRSFGCRLQQTGDGRIVDPARVAAGELVNLIFHYVVKDLWITAVMSDLIIDVAARLLLGQRSELIANADPIDDVRILGSLQGLANVLLAN